MNRATFSFLLGLFVFLFGAVSQSSALPTSVVGHTLSSKGLHSQAKSFDVVPVAQTFVTRSQGSGSGKENQSFDSSLFEKEEEEKSCSFNALSSDLRQVLISYAGVLNLFQQMVEEKLHVLANSHWLKANEHTVLLQKFQI